MRILFADLEREWRGGQSQALLTLRGLRKRGIGVELLAARNAPLARRALEAGIKVHEVARLGLRAWAARVFGELLARDKFDVIHLNEPHALAAAWLARAHRRLPLLLSRRIGFPLKKNAVSKRLYCALERFVANSRDVARSLIESGISEEKISIVNEGVEIPPPVTPDQRRKARQRWGFEDHHFVVGCVSMLVPEKGQRHLIAALPKVRAAHPEVRLLLAGDGPCRSELQTLAKRVGQFEAVLFAGFVSDVDEVYAALDAFAFPSEFEGLGTALQDGMARGLAAVSTTRGALGEVVDDGRTALVAEPDAESLAAALCRLLGDEDLRRRLGDSARREVQERFSADRMVESTIRAYEDVLQKRREQ